MLKWKVTSSVHVWASDKSMTQLLSGERKTM